VITLTATANCLRCPWSAGPGNQATVDKQAERHTRVGHPTATLATPMTTAGSPPAAVPKE
jgi:hypothetical protein